MQKSFDKILLVLFCLLVLYLAVKAETLLDTQTIALNYVTMTNYQLADWDTCFCVIKKWDDTVIDTVGLAHGDPGRWYATYSASGLKGDYHKEYYCIDGDDTTMESYAFAVHDPDDFKDGAGCTAPTGVCQITLLIADSDDTSTISQCQVQIWNKANSKLEWYEYTNSSGIVSFLFDADTLMIKCYKPQYSFTIPESLFITANVTDTIFGTTSLVYPPQASLCRVYSWIFNQQYQADTTFLVKIENILYDNSTGEYKTTVPLRFQNSIISPYILYTNPDTSGWFCFDLHITSALNPDTTWYLLTAEDAAGNQILERGEGDVGILFQIPDTATVDYWIEW